MHIDIERAQRACRHDGLRAIGGLRGAQQELCMLCGAVVHQTEPELWRAVCALAEQHERAMDRVR